jgi:hypothetical protein
MVNSFSVSFTVYEISFISITIAIAFITFTVTLITYPLSFIYSILTIYHYAVALPLSLIVDLPAVETVLVFFHAEELTLTDLLVVEHVGLHLVVVREVIGVPVITELLLLELQLLRLLQHGPDLLLVEVRRVTESA